MITTVVIYHNEADGHFERYIRTDNWMVPVFTYAWDVPESGARAEVEKVLAEAYRLFNADPGMFEGARDQLVRAYRSLHLRSLSIGDVVSFPGIRNGFGDTVAFACGPGGSWQRIDVQQMNVQLSQWRLFENLDGARHAARKITYSPLKPGSSVFTFGDPGGPETLPDPPVAVHLPAPNPGVMESLWTRTECGEPVTPDMRLASSLAFTTCDSCIAARTTGQHG